MPINILGRPTQVFLWGNSDSSSKRYNKQKYYLLRQYNSTVTLLFVYSKHLYSKGTFVPSDAKMVITAVRLSREIQWLTERVVHIFSCCTVRKLTLSLNCERRRSSLTSCSTCRGDGTRHLILNAAETGTTDA